MPSLVDLLDPVAHLEMAANLTALQTQQIWKQIRIQWDGVEGEAVQLEDSTVFLQYHSDVMRPYSSREMANWILRNPDVVRGKRVLDMGCGTGIQGISALRAGAAAVEFVDVIPDAVELTKANVVKNFQSLGAASFVNSDLFESLNDLQKYDVIIFAQPYFSGEPLTEVRCTWGMLMPTYSVETFMTQAHDFLQKDGRLLMEAWDFGSPENDPRLLAGRFGWEVEARVALNRISHPVQKGRFELAVLSH